MVYAAAAKFTGSGGAIVVFCPEGTSQAQKLEQLCSKQGFLMVKVLVGGPCDLASTSAHAAELDHQHA